MVVGGVGARLKCGGAALSAWDGVRACVGGVGWLWGAWVRARGGGGVARAGLSIVISVAQ